MHIEVNATSEKEAESAAWNEYNERGEDAGEIEWELVDHVTRGNMCSAPLNDIEVNECKESP
jgi:hypothetical protein